MTPVRYTAMHGLEIAGQAAIPPLRLTLMDNNPIVRRNAAEMLGWLRAADAVPDLTQSLSDQDATVRAQANWALGEIDTRAGSISFEPGGSRCRGETHCTDGRHNGGRDHQGY